MHEGLHKDYDCIVSLNISESIENIENVLILHVPITTIAILILRAVR